jgi:hypothetical protein
MSLSFYGNDAWGRWRKRQYRLEILVSLVVVAAAIVGDYETGYGWDVLIAGLGLCWWADNWSTRWYRAEEKREDLEREERYKHAREA